jgi:hypothetical protein
LASVAVYPAKIPPPTDNLQYHVPEILPGLAPMGAALDISAWEFRKPVNISSTGAQQLELDLDVLSRARSGFDDIRIMSGRNQVPFIIQHTSINRSLTPVVANTNDPQTSRWTIRLPCAHLPLTRLTCHSRTLVFERDLSLYEDLTDERGDSYRHVVGTASWRQTPGHAAPELSLTVDDAIQSDTLILETENGDNPPLSLDTFEVYYPVTRVLFKAQAMSRLFLYYGNPQAAAPSYDLNLVAGELLAADKKKASLAAEERLKKSSWRETSPPGQGGLLLWGILALVVIVLLVIISRLLPKKPV